MKHFTIDQAGKIEHTNKDTILALYSNEIQYTIKIPKKLKQKLFLKCNKRYKTQLTLRIFSYCLYLLLKNKSEKDDLIIIDDEYPKHNDNIKALLLNHLKIKKENIQFDLIGKKDLSHKIANQTFSGKLKPNEIITEKQLNLEKIAPRSKLKKLLK